MKNTSKKHEQLGMNPSTASARLIKDLLFKFALGRGYKCFQCGKDLTRNTFSIEHKIPWLDSENPRELYFDLDNIAFSHLQCNTKVARRFTKSVSTGASSLIGVHYRVDGVRNKRWYTKAVVNGKNIFKGYFLTELEAHKEYIKLRELKKI